MIKSPRDLLPLLTGVLLTLVSLGLAWFALSALQESAYGKALIFAGGAIAFGVLPLSKMSRPDPEQSHNDLPMEAIKKPEPLPMQIAIGIAWLLILAGLISFFL